MAPKSANVALHPYVSKSNCCWETKKKDVQFIKHLQKVTWWVFAYSFVRKCIYLDRKVKKQNKTKQNKTKKKTGTTEENAREEMTKTGRTEKNAREEMTKKKKPNKTYPVKMPSKIMISMQ